MEMKTLTETEYMKGISRWFETPDYPTNHHCKTADNAALWFWLWYCYMETGDPKISQLANISMRATGIKAKKDYRRALRDLEALGFVKSVKFGRAMLAEDDIIIEVPSPDTHTQGLN